MKFQANLNDYACTISQVFQRIAEAEDYGQLIDRETCAEIVEVANEVIKDARASAGITT